MQWRGVKRQSAFYETRRYPGDGLSFPAEDGEKSLLPGDILLFSCLWVLSCASVTPTPLPTVSFELAFCKLSPRGQLLRVSLLEAELCR